MRKIEKVHLKERINDMNKKKMVKRLTLLIDIILVGMLCFTIYLLGIVFPNIFTKANDLMESMKITLTFSSILSIVFTVFIFILDIYIHYRTNKYFNELESESKEVIELEKESKQ